MATDPRVNITFSVKTPCVFCDIVNGQAPATFVYRWAAAVAIVPLNPVTPGHVLVVPRAHVSDSSVDPVVTGSVASYAAELARMLTNDGDYNLIVNCGADASQTVEHLHWHIVPRREGDGLHLPWTAQVRNGICGHQAPGFVDAAPVHCELLSGHGGWHQGGGSHWNRGVAL